jgi:hypothetical protein
VPFYTRLEPDPALARGYVFLLDEIDVHLLRGRPDKAAKVRRIIQRMWREYDRLGVDGAVKVDELIRARIRTTAVRPPTSGALEGAIQSRPLPSTFPAGAVGIADLDPLTAATMRANANEPYWRAQEYGYSGNVGRRLRGFFGDSPPGTSPASGAEFRHHPYFFTGPGPRMVIRQPIYSRHFLRDGTADFAAWHGGESARILREATIALGRV